MSAAVNDPTTLEKRDGYLSQHLRKVLSEIQLTAGIGLAATGIDHCVEQYDKPSVTIDTPGPSEGAAVQLIERLLSRRPDTGGH